MIEHVMSTRSTMAKMKSGKISTDRKNDELRDVNVTLDFTPNALSSLLYKPGDTSVLVCVTKPPPCQDGFQRIQTGAGSMQNIPFYQDQLLSLIHI